MLFRHNTLSALACAILLTACTTTTPPPPSARLATASASLSSADICAGLNALDEKTAGAKLDLPELMVNKIKEIGKTDNEGVCRMTPDERAAIMLVHRNRYKNPKRKSLIPATKEFIRMWDADDNGQQPTTDQILAADSARRQLMRTSENAKKGGISGDAGINSSSWQFIGPGNVGGRIRSVLIDPRNTNRILLGSVTGGMWLSTNGGQSFAPVADFLSNIAIGAMSFDPTNPNIVYAGTGESYQGFSGVGLYKSLDSGLTWSLLSSTSTSLNSDWVYTNRIAVNQANPSIVLAANNGGVYRSSNGGGSWSRVLSGAATDVRIDPNNANNALASKSDGFMYYSRDGGLTWTQSSSLANAGQRAEIAYARSRADLVFISLNNNKGEIWKSEDGGQTWTMMSNPMHLSTQGDYANTIWVSPVDENHLVVGGLDLHQSQDGGLNFTRISTWQAGGEGLP
ncbi:MAG: hypothetical protein JNM52_10660, partial [Betaproteobacteria bacterium]|nr:hypothetical protein [Betaproteobacteria bacterium]